VGKLGIAAVAICAGVSFGCAASPPAALTPATEATPTTPPLPAGYVALAQPDLRVGVPASWIRVGRGASPATLARIEAKYPSMKSRLASTAAGNQPGRMFAIDPSSTSEVLVLVFPTPGVTPTRSGLSRVYTSDLKPVFAQDKIDLQTHHLTRLGGVLALRLTANYLRKGVTVPEVIDLAVSDGKLFDLTFSGDAGTIKQVESTIAIG
jgi:hypothetical protein